MYPSQKVTIGSIVDDWMAIFPLKRAGWGAFMEHIFGNMSPKEH